MTNRGKRTKNKDGGTPTKSPNHRNKKKGKRDENDPNDEEKDEEMTPTQLFTEPTSSDEPSQHLHDEKHQDEQTNDNSIGSSDENKSEENDEFNTIEEITALNKNKEVPNDQKNHNTSYAHKLDLVAPFPPKMWTTPIASANNAWKLIRPSEWTDLKPLQPFDLQDEEGDETGDSVRAVIDIGIELIQGGFEGKNPAINNWLQVIQSVLIETNPTFTDYTKVRTLVYRLAITDPVQAFDKSQWFNQGLNQTLEIHRLWIATYLTFGAPWKDRVKWLPNTKLTEIVNPYKKIVKFGKKDDADDPAKSGKLPGKYKPNSQTFSMFLNKPLVMNPAKSQVLQKTKDFTRNYRTYAKIRLAQITSDSYAEQETEVAASLKLLLSHMWSIDGSMIILPWRREEAFPPLRKGTDTLRSKADVDKYVDRCWMEKNKAPYCRILIAHNATRDKIFEDANLQNWLMTSQIILQVERIQAHSLSKAGHLLGYHATVCNCDNLADTLQQHPLLKGISIEARSEFITFKIGRGPPKPAERTKTKIIQLYVATDSAGTARRALTQIYSSQARGRYPLGVTARFIPNVNDLRFIRPPQVSMAYMNSLKKHIEFMAQTTTYSSENIIELDAVIDRFGMSLRQAIMHIFSASRSNWNLFVAVDTSFYGNCVNFAFREELQVEAMNMISALPLFLEAHFGHSDVWKWFTRRARDEAADYEWNLEKGLVPKYDATMDTQLEDWEQLDEIDEIHTTNVEIAFQPFTLDLQAFGSNTYGDENTIQTSALLAAAQEDNGTVRTPDPDEDEDDRSDIEVLNLSGLTGSTVSTAFTTTSASTSTLTASPEQMLLAEFPQDDPDVVAFFEKLRLKKSQASSPAVIMTVTGNEANEHK